MLAGHTTVTHDRGVFLPTTFRMSPSITAFTSEMFYESRLFSREGLENQLVSGSAGLNGSGLRLVFAKHDGNKSTGARVGTVDKFQGQTAVAGDLFDGHKPP